MAYREVPRMEIQEIIRRWLAGGSLNNINEDGANYTYTT